MEDTALLQLDMTTLAQVIERLSPTYHYLLMAKYFLELSDEAIANHLNIDPNHVRIYIMRARRKALLLFMEMNHG